jgi:hypothetical protein
MMSEGSSKRLANHRARHDLVKPATTSGRARPLTARNVASTAPASRSPPAPARYSFGRLARRNAIISSDEGECDVVSDFNRRAPPRRAD